MSLISCSKCILFLLMMIRLASMSAASTKPSGFASAFGFLAISGVLLRSLRLTLAHVLLVGPFALNGFGVEFSSIGLLVIWTFVLIDVSRLVVSRSGLVG